jgi:DNA-binding NarL/FixJ family response regulator
MIADKLRSFPDDTAQLFLQGLQLRIQGTQLHQETRRLMGELKESRRALQNSLMEYRYRTALTRTEWGGEASPASKLPPRQLEVLKLIASGCSTKEIAARLGITFKTAVAHRTRLMENLGLHDIAGLTRLAVRWGLVEP